MPKLRTIFLSLVAFMVAQSNDLRAQNSSAPSALPPAKEVSGKGMDKFTKNRVFSLGLKWNESSRQFLLPVENTTDRPIEILGVQATGDIYVSAIPKQIPAKGSVKLALYIVSRDGSSNTQDHIRVLTSVGEQMLHVAHDRQQSISLEPGIVSWTVGQAANAKSVVITIVVPGIGIRGVRAAGEGNSATFEDTGGGTYRVNIVPGTTSKANTFPVFIDIHPRLAGVAAVISCEILEAH